MPGRVADVAGAVGQLGIYQPALSGANGQRAKRGGMAGLACLRLNASRPGDVTFNPQYKPYAEKSISGDGMARIGYGRVKQPNGDGARQTNVISLPTVASDGNRPRARGVSFPLALPERFIRQYTRPGDVVLDFCAGVGTTCRAARDLGRRYIGIEIDPDEADKARAWLREPAQARLLATIVDDG